MSDLVRDFDRICQEHTVLREGIVDPIGNTYRFDTPYGWVLISDYALVNTTYEQRVRLMKSALATIKKS